LISNGDNHAVQSLKLVKRLGDAHLNLCRLLHSSACLPERDRAPERFPFDVVV
jgi:hypothetical protein